MPSSRDPIIAILHIIQGLWTWVFSTVKRRFQNHLSTRRLMVIITSYIHILYSRRCCRYYYYTSPTDKYTYNIGTGTRAVYQSSPWRRRKTSHYRLLLLSSLSKAQKVRAASFLTTPKTTKLHRQRSSNSTTTTANYHTSFMGLYGLNIGSQRRNSRTLAVHFYNNYNNKKIMKSRIVQRWRSI